jgi:hypothetical protein
MLGMLPVIWGWDQGRRMRQIGTTGKGGDGGPFQRFPKFPSGACSARPPRLRKNRGQGMIRVGSNSEVGARNRHVRYPPDSDQIADIARGPFRAMKRHSRRRSLRRLGLGGSRGSPKNLLRVVNGSGTKIPAATWERETVARRYDGACRG